MDTLHEGKKKGKKETESSGWVMNEREWFTIMREWVMSMREWVSWKTLPEFRAPGNANQDQETISMRIINLCSKIS